MNKWQIICPLAAMALFAVVGSFLLTRSFERRTFLDSAWNVGHELITTTNSTHLTSIEPAFRSSSARFLAAPAKVAGVRRENSESGRSAERRAVVFGTNDAGERMHITLAWDPKANLYTVVSYRYPAPPPPPAPR